MTSLVPSSPAASPINRESLKSHANSGTPTDVGGTVPPASPMPRWSRIASNLNTEECHFVTREDRTGYDEAIRFHGSS